MAAKRKVAPAKPRPNRSWSELTNHEQNTEYTRALHAYSQGDGPNPQTRPQYYRQRVSAENGTAGGNG